LTAHERSECGLRLGRAGLQRGCGSRARADGESTLIAGVSELAAGALILSTWQTACCASRVPSERLRWLTAVAFFSLLVSGLVVGRRGTFHNMMYAWHLASAGVLVTGIVLVFVAGNRHALESSAHELLRLGPDDRRWLASASSRLRARLPMPATGRFNAGQKLNFVSVCVLLVALYVSDASHA
jgi:hypothetical protein